MEPLHGYLYDSLIGLPWEATRFEGFQALQAKLQQHYQYGGPSHALAYMDGLLKTGMAAEKAMIGNVNGAANGNQLGTQLWGNTPNFTQAATQAVQDAQTNSMSTSAGMQAIAPQQPQLGAVQHSQQPQFGSTSVLGSNSVQQQGIAQSSPHHSAGALQQHALTNGVQQPVAVQQGALQQGPGPVQIAVQQQAIPLAAIQQQQSRAEAGRSTWSAIVRQSTGNGSDTAAHPAAMGVVDWSAEDEEYSENNGGHANGVLRPESRSQAGSAAGMNGIAVDDGACEAPEGALEEPLDTLDGPYLALGPLGAPAEAILESVSACSWYCVGCGVDNTLTTLKRAACHSCERSLCMLGVRLQCDGTFADHPCRMMHLAIPQANVDALLSEELPQGKAAEVSAALARYVEHHANDTPVDPSTSKPSPRGSSKGSRVAVPIPTSPAPKPKTPACAALVNVAEATWLCEPCNTINTITSIKTAKCTSCNKDLCFSYIKGHCNGTHNGRPCKLLHLVVADNVRGMPTHRSNAKHDIPDMLRCFVQRCRLESKQ